MKQAVLALLGLTGCDVVFGLDRAPPDAPPDQIVSGRITRRYLHGDTGLVLIAETAPLVQAEAPTVRFDGRDISVGWSASEGLFTFEVPSNDTYQLLYDGVEYQLTAPSVKINALIPGRPDAIAPAAGTVLRITPTSAMPQGGNVYVLTTGIFSTTKPNTVSPLEFTLNWANATFLGTPGLLAAAKFDEAYLVSYADDARGYEVLDTIVPVSVTLEQGTMTTGSGPVTPVARDRCAQMDPDPINAELVRLRSVYPQFSIGGTFWQLLMMARPDLDSTVAYTVGTATLTNLDSPVDVQYGVPLPSFGPLVTYAARVDRDVGDTRLSATVRYFDRIDDSATCNPHPLAMGIAVPTRPQLASVAITDNVTIGLPAGVDPLLTWEDAAGTIAPTSYRVSLIDLSSDRLVRTINTAHPRAVIDESLLEAGTRYLFEISGTTRFPGFADGDLTRQGFPVATGVVRTPPFQVSR